MRLQHDTQITVRTLHALLGFLMVDGNCDCTGEANGAMVERDGTVTITRVEYRGGRPE